MIRVWVTAPRWRADAAFKTWLYRVTVNLCLNRRRQKPFAPLDEAGEPPDPSPSAEEAIEGGRGERACRRRDRKSSRAAKSGYLC